jgi:hypothetical protein
MKGAMADVWANINSMAKNTMITTIGINHQSLRCHKKISNSPKRPNLNFNSWKTAIEVHLLVDFALAL